MASKRVAHAIGLLRNPSGQSLVMSLVGMGVIATVGLTGAYMYSTTSESRKDLNTLSLCRDLGENVIRTIRSNGTQSRIFRAPRLGNQVVNLNEAGWRNDRTLNSNGVDREVGAAPEASRWPALQLLGNYSSNTPPYKSNMPLLIQGSVNGLLSLYNWSSGSFCTSGRGLELREENPVLGALAPPTKVGPFTVRASMRIRPYDRNTLNVIDPCPPGTPAAPYLIRPQALEEPPSAVRKSIICFDATCGSDGIVYQTDRGLQVEVFVDLESTELVVPPGSPPGTAGETYKIACNTKANFQYDTMTEPPPGPEVTTTSTGPNSLNVRVILPAEEHHATQIVCRQRHRFINYAHASILTYRGMAWPAETVGPWSPCGSMQVCGRAPSSSSENYETGIIEANYNVPSYCDVTVEAMAFDVVGNVSSSESYHYSQGPGGGTPDEDGTESENNADGSSRGVGYEVSPGLQFDTIEAAEMARALGGGALHEIPKPTAPLDDQMRATYGAMVGGQNQQLAAASHLGAALGAAGRAQSAAAGAGGAASAASAATAASAAEAAASQATAAASAATAAAAAAESALRTTIAQGASLGPVGANAVAAAQAAATQARADAIAAEAAAEAARRAAEEARRAAEEKAREEAEAAEEDDKP